MGQTVKVAVVRAGTRREAVANALALLDDELMRVVRNDVLVKPNLVSHTYQLPSTNADTFGVVLDSLFSAGARRVVVAEGASDASKGFERFNLRDEVKGRLVAFYDLNREETEWEPLALTGVDGSPLTARVSRTICESTCRVSLALAKTHVTSILTLSLKNMLSSIHPDDRVMMHGHSGGGNGYTGWKRLAVEFLKQDNRLVNTLTRAMGRVKNAKNAWRWSRVKGDAFHALSQSELGFLKTVETMNRNLVALSKKTRPHLSVVDGFVGMHREGPRHGTPIRLETVIVGTDPVAVDAVSAAVMGFDPKQIGYLVYAQDAGIGVSDLERIVVVGDSIASVKKPFVPHSNYAVQRHWQRLAGSPILRGPHSTTVQTRSHGIKNR